MLTFKQWKEKKNFPAQQQQQRPATAATAAASAVTAASSSDAGTSFGELENKENESFVIGPNQNFATYCLGLNNLDKKKKASNKRKVLGEKNTGTEKRTESRSLLRMSCGTA